MRARIFLAFLLVASAAVVSNLLFERLVRKDFADLVGGVREDQSFLLTAATEGAYREGRWDGDALRSAVLWALMLGYEIEIRDVAGAPKISTTGWLQTIDVWQERRLAGIGALPLKGEDAYAETPLFVQGERIGLLRIRPGGDPFARREREATFYRRGGTFLWLSLGIGAVGTALFVFVMVVFLERPLGRFVRGAEQVRSGDLSVIIPSGGGGDLENLRLAFNEMVETLGRQEERRKRLVADVAHELRTPLTILRGTVEGMEDGVVATGKETFHELLSETERLERLVGGIEELARAESGRFFLEKRTEAMDQIIAEAVRPFEPLFDEKGLSLTFEGAAVKADVDGGRIRQVVANLLSNALRHTETGGVVVRVFGEQDDADVPCVVVQVSDTGTGIPEEDRHQIFDRFFRGPRGRGSDQSGPGSGLGLGLAIVKEIAEAHDGSVAVSSITGRGTTVRVLLPLRRRTS